MDTPEIVMKVERVIGDEVRSALAARCPSCKKKYAEIMATVCLLLVEGKIILKEMEDK